MKKNILLLLVAFGLLVGCSSEDNAASSTGDKLQRAVFKDNNGNVILTQSYEYSGEKLSRIVFSSGNYNAVFYTDDFITRIESFSNNALSSTATIQYNSDGKISSMITLSGSNGYKTTYTYNNDDTVDVLEYTGDLSSQNTLTKTHKAFLENDIMVKRETYGTGANSGITYTRDYSYDTENNPMHAILGYGRLNFFEIGSVVTPNNLTEIVYSQSDSTQTSTTTTSYTYNSQNFPTSSAEAVDGTLIKTVDYIY